MIKFLRHIRQQLLSEGKTGSYLKYAIGEIILVVFGILIALQINAWYENSKKVKLKHVYTKNLIKDLTNDTIQLNDRLILNENTFLKISDSIINIINHPKTTVNEVKELAKTVGIGGLRIVNNYNTNTFQILTSSGNIDLFDEDVIQKIMELDALQNFELNISSNNRDTYFDIYNRYREQYLHQPINSNETIMNELWDNVDAFEHAPIYINAVNVGHHAMTRYVSLTKEVLDKTEELLQILEEQ